MTMKWLRICVWLCVCALASEKKIGYWHLNNHCWACSLPLSYKYGLFLYSFLHFAFRITVRDGGGGDDDGGSGCIWSYRKYRKNLARHIKQCERKLSFRFLLILMDTRLFLPSIHYPQFDRRKNIFGWLHTANAIHTWHKNEPKWHH